MSERRTDEDSADKKAHGTHGRGKSSEQRVDDADVEPDAARGTDRGAAGWGSEGAGGSVIDKRGEK